jgi:hypothetical protein
LFVSFRDALFARTRNSETHTLALDSGFEASPRPGMTEWIVRAETCVVHAIMTSPKVEPRRK